MPEGSRTHLGGTMRLGLRPTLFQSNSDWSTVRKLYGGEEIVHERHRHRYEINPDYITRLEEHGLQFIGRDDQGERMEIFELRSRSELTPSHPYYVGVQYHPELKRYIPLSVKLMVVVLLIQVHRSWDLLLLVLGFWRKYWVE
jgi:CTP synthase